jgi:hypothetical protein
MDNLFYSISYKDIPLLRDWSTDPKSVYTGVAIPADNVYSYADGVVLAVGYFAPYYCITIQYDVFNLLRYDHLSSVDVGAGDVVQVGTILGRAALFVRFEYATKVQNSSKWSVRVGTQTYWKQDPKELLL